MKQEIKKLSSIILMLCAVVLCTCCQDEDYTAKFKNVDCQDIIGRVYMNDRQIDIEPVLSRDEITPFGYIGEEGIVILSLKNKEAEIRELKPKYIQFSGKAKLKKVEDLDVGGTCYYDLTIDKYQEVFPPKDSISVPTDDRFACGTDNNVPPPDWFFSEDTDN